MKPEHIAAAIAGGVLAYIVVQLAKGRSAGHVSALLVDLGFTPVPPVAPALDAAEAEARELIESGAHHLGLAEVRRIAEKSKGGA